MNPEVNPDGNDRMAIDARRLDANWRAITTELAVPRAARAERVLCRLGLPRRHARVVLATPALRRAWYLAIVIAAVVGLGATDPDQPTQSVFTLLVLAPLLPVLGVALAYGPGSDPMYEVQLATPMSGLRLVAVRAATVLVVSIVVIVGVSLVSEVARPMAAVWLLPALMLTVASLAAMTYVPPRRATTLVAVVWVGLVVGARLATEDELAAFAPAGQLACLALAVGLGAVAVTRRERFDRLQVAP